MSLVQHIILWSARVGISGGAYYGLRKISYVLTTRNDCPIPEGLTVISGISYTHPASCTMNSSTPDGDAISAGAWLSLISPLAPS